MSIIDLTSKINQLQAENEQLAERLSQCEYQADTESRARQQAEERNRQLEGELSTLRAEGGTLQQENTRLSTTVEQLTKRIERSDNEVKKAWSVLYRLGPDPYSRDIT